MSSLRQCQVQRVSLANHDLEFGSVDSSLLQISSEASSLCLQITSESVLIISYESSRFFSKFSNNQRVPCLTNHSRLSEIRNELHCSVIGNLYAVYDYSVELTPAKIVQGNPVQISSTNSLPVYASRCFSHFRLMIA